LGLRDPLDLAVLDKDEAKAWQAAGDALAQVREPWEPETTADNLRLIREVRAERNEALPCAPLPKHGTNSINSCVSLFYM
jgi:uncharacterized protein DUF4071